jgi:hypothetical protein
LNADLALETEKLVQSWEQHEAAWLRDYLVAGVEDPRLNLQSILSRHFLINELAPGRFSGLMRQEYRFAAAMQWLLGHSELSSEPEARNAALHALRKGADNAEGLEIPGFIVQTFANLPVATEGGTLPNYVEMFLAQAQGAESIGSREKVLDTCALLWQSVLLRHFPDCGRQQHDGANTKNDSESDLKSKNTTRALPKLLEPACGSANDYRFLERYGLARLFDYTGFDLCKKNIQNACELFPAASFQMGNIFEISAPARTFDFCIVHDLFEHFSMAGLEQAVGEICRVTRQNMCLGFFQMDEIAEHIVRPRDDYYWNLLSLPRMKGLFESHGFIAQAINLGAFLAHHTGCQNAQNPNAYAFIVRANKGAQGD